MRHFDMRPFEGCSKSSLSIVNYVLFQGLGLTIPSVSSAASRESTFPQPREGAYDDYTYGFMSHNVMLKKCSFAGASVTLVPTCVQQRKAAVRVLRSHQIQDFPNLSFLLGIMFFPRTWNSNPFRLLGRQPRIHLPLSKGRSLLLLLNSKFYCHTLQC